MMDELLFDDCGQRLAVSSPQLALILNYPDPDFDIVAYAVRNLGFIHVKPVGRSILITFRPSRASHLAFGSVCYNVAERAPARVFLSYRESDQLIEVCRNAAEGLARMEAVLAEARNPAARLMYQAQRQPVERLADISKDRLLPVYQAWTEARAQWSPALFGRLLHSGLLDLSVVVRNPAGGERLVIEHHGTGFHHYTRRWSRLARGRNFEDQPDRNYGAWIAAGYRDTLSEGQPRLEAIDAVTYTPSRRETQRNRYDRLLLPWRLPDGDRILSTASVSRTSVVL